MARHNLPDFASQDLYRCPQGQVLRPTFRLERIQEVQYRADAAVCKLCPVKTECTESPGGRRVHRSFFADYVERVKGYQQTLAYQKALNKRKVWVEPLFAEGKQWHGMGRFRLRRHGPRQLRGPHDCFRPESQTEARKSEDGGGVPFLQRLLLSRLLQTGSQKCLSGSTGGKATDSASLRHH